MNLCTSTPGIREVGIYKHGNGGIKHVESMSVETPEQREAVRTFQRHRIRGTDPPVHPYEFEHRVPEAVYGSIWLDGADLGYLARVPHKIVTYRNSDPTGQGKLQELGAEDPATIARTICFMETYKGKIPKEFETEASGDPGKLHLFVVPMGSPHLDADRLRSIADLECSRLLSFEQSRVLPPGQGYGSMSPFQPHGILLGGTVSKNTYFTIGGVYFDSGYVQTYGDHIVDFGIGAVNVPKRSREKASIQMKPLDALNVLESVMPTRVHFVDILRV